MSPEQLKQLQKLSWPFSSPPSADLPTLLSHPGISMNPGLRKEARVAQKIARLGHLRTRLLTRFQQLGCWLHELSRTREASVHLEPNMLNTSIPDGPEALEHLLTDPDFDAVQFRDSLIKEDLLYPLTFVPFEFRRVAHKHIIGGTRRFGKAPYTDGGKGQRCGNVRPLSCPEPPGDGCSFSLAWWDGISWHDKPVNYWHGEEPSDKDNISLHYFETVEAEIRKRMEETEDVRNVHNSATIIWSLLKELIEDTEIPLSAIQKAFVAGTIYESGIRYPRTRELHLLLGTDLNFESWPSIIRMALERHGVGLTPKALVQKLGCNNPERLKRTSKATLEFHSAADGFPTEDRISANSFYQIVLSQKKEFSEKQDGRKALAQKKKKRQADRKAYQKRKLSPGKNASLKPDMEKVKKSVQQRKL